MSSCASMHSPSKYDLQAAGQADNEGADDSELNILRDIFRMLPHGVTVQDGHGRLLLANDAAAAQLQIDEAGPSSGAMEHRRETGTELLRAGQGAIVEESVTNGAATQVLLTSHRPVRIAERDLLLSSSADITGQKAFEDTLFRAAYYDELTGLPSRRVIEHRVDKLLQVGDKPPGEKTAGFALAFLDIDNFKHINDYYGHAIGDALLVGITKRLGMTLRESDMLSRISGDEFLLLQIGRASCREKV